MSRRKAHAMDVVEYTVCGPLFFVVAAATAAAMAVGFSIMTLIDRLLHYLWAAACDLVRRPWQLYSAPVYVPTRFHLSLIHI